MVIKYRSNLTCGIVSILAAIVMFVLIPAQVEIEEKISYGISSRTIPYGIATVFAVCGVILILQSLVLKKDKTKELNLKAEIPAGLMFLVLIVYMFLFEIEWPLSTAAVGCAALWFSKSKKWYDYAITVVLSIAMYLLFVNVLHIRLHSAVFGLIGL